MASEFRDKLEELLEFAPGLTPQMQEHLRAFYLAGGRASLLVAADAIKIELDPFVPLTRRWLIEKAGELK